MYLPPGQEEEEYVVAAPPVRKSTRPARASAAAAAAAATASSASGSGGASEGSSEGDEAPSSYSTPLKTAYSRQAIIRAIAPAHYLPCAADRILFACVYLCICRQHTHLRCTDDVALNGGLT